MATGLPLKSTGDTFTAAEYNTLKSAVDSVDDIKHTHTNEAILGATTASYTIPEKTKLDGIETGATADQTGAEIKAAYEAEADTNAFTDVEKAKLTGVELGATADQTGAEIKAAYEAEADTNAFTDAEKAQVGALGTASTLNTGTAPSELPTNADVFVGKNYIVNSDMAVSQENGDGPNAITPLGSALFYGADQWGSVNGTGSGATLTIERGVLNNRRTHKTTATVAATDLTTTKSIQLLQALEAQNVFALNGKNITISFKCNTNWTGNLALAIVNFDGTRSYVQDIPVISGENDCLLTVPLEAATIGVNSNTVGLSLRIGVNNEGDFQTATTGAWQANFNLCSTSSTQWAKTAGNFIEITEVQLVEGTVAPKYQPYTDPVYRSERYGELITLEAGDVGTAQVFSTSTGAGFIPFKHAKRQIPSSSTLQSGTINLASANGASTGATGAIVVQNQFGVRVDFTGGTSGLAQGQAGNMFVTGGPAKIFVSARL